MLSLQDNIILLFDAYSKHINHELIKMTCELENKIELLGHLQILGQWENKLKTLFKYPLLGKISGPLTPDLLNTAQLKEILETHPQLLPLIYSQKLSNFYAVSRISIGEVRLTAYTLNIHYILHVPSIKVQNTYPLYAVRQVGIHGYNSC